MLKKLLMSLTMFFCIAEIKIGGLTSEFVNKVLDKVRAGQNNGGLNDI